ncbi:unnamed protein product [Meloidogyne enterolobii]|uniref:Uncharacterized protein n=1 Tax=Meloidogyne enterolobii TaxID=390850 RepID=A0ACB0ZGW6_MELEN
MKINFKTYFLYTFSTILIVASLYNLIGIVYAMRYFDGGIKQFDGLYSNKTFHFVIVKSVVIKS